MRSVNSFCESCALYEKEAVIGVQKGATLSYRKVRGKLEICPQAFPDFLVSNIKLPVIHHRVLMEKIPFDGMDGEKLISWSLSLVAGYNTSFTS